MEPLVLIKELEEKLRLLESQNSLLEKEKKATKSLQPIQYLNSDTLFQDLFLNMRNACVIYTVLDGGKDFLIRDVNPSFERIEKIAKKDIVGKCVSKGLSEMGSEFIEILCRVNQTGKGENHIFPRIDNNDTILWRDNDIFKLASGEVVAVYEDVSVLKEKELELINSEARYKALSDSTNEAVFFMIDSYCVDVNTTGLDMFGYSREEAIGKHALSIIDKDYHELTIKNLQNNYTQSYEALAIHKDGSRFPVRILGRTFMYQGQLTRITTMRDISEEKEKEKSLLKSEAKFRSYFEDHKAIKLQVDVETKKIVDANKAAVDFYGYTKEELLKKTIFDLNALPKEEVLELMKKAKSGDQSAFSFPHRLKSGELRDVKAYTTIIEVDGRANFFSILHDVTEATKTEKELQRSEARFRAYFENNTAAMLQIDPKSKQIIEANEAALRFYGYSYEQFKKLKAYDINILPPDEIDKKLQEVMASPAQRFIFEHRLSSGESKEVEVFVSLIHTNMEAQLFVTVYDVSEREETKRALEENEQKLINAQSIAKTGNWEIVFETNEMFWSDEIYSIFEIGKDYPLTIDNYNRLIHPDDIAQLTESFINSLEHKESFNSTHRILSSKDKIKYVEEKGYTIYDKKGKPLRSLGTTQDITERKLVEIELQKSKSYLDEAQRIAKVGNFELYLDDKTANWSDEVYRIYGFEIENKKPTFEKYRKQMHPDDIENQYAIFSQALKEKRGYTVTYRITSLSGEEKQIEEKGYFELDKKGNPIKVIGTMQDITSNFLVKKALEESRAQLTQINEELEKRVKEELEKSRDKDHLLIQQSRSAVLGEMIGNIAHQWRQPLNEVSLLINDLEDAYSFGMLNKAYFEKTTEIVYRRLKYMSDTINDFSKMHTDDFKKEAFSPKERIKKLIQFTAGTIKKNKIQIRFMCNDDFEVQGYPNMLSHILLNLLNNSRDILVERSIKRPKIWIKLEKNESNYCIRVLDNGKGIDKDVIDKIFDPYFTTKDKKRGSGLGLYMTKSMVEKQMHGQIQVQNQRDGAEFKITLDLKNENV